MHGGIGQVLHDVEEQLAGEHRAPFFFDERGDGVLNGQLQVRGLQRHVIVLRIEVNAGQDRQR